MATEKSLLVRNQSGAALVIALIILVVLTVISLSSNIMSITEIKLSGNKRGNTDAFYTADGGVQAAMANLVNFNSSTYTAIQGTGGISPHISGDILSQCDTYLEKNTSTSTPRVILATLDGGTFTKPPFTPPPEVKIYHQTHTGAPKGLGFSATGNVGYEYYVVDSTGVDQTDIGSLRSRSEVVTTVVRIMPSQLGGNL